MNDQTIESLLRKSPIPRVPDGLLENLLGEIRLPRAATGPAEWGGPQPFLRRWFPALAFGLIMLTCIVVAGIQTNLLDGLKREAGLLTAQTQNLDGLRQTNAEVVRLRNENSQLDRLQTDNAELHQLRAEIARLQSQAANIPQLKAENTRLLAASQNAPGAPRDFFAEGKEKAEMLLCVNNLKQIGLAMRIWAGDNNGNYPPNFISISNELNNWKILQCPSDTAHTITGWADVEVGMSGYQLYSAGLAETNDPNTVVVECPIHHNVGLLDGSVQMLGGPNFRYSDHIKVVNGVKVFQP
jgi:hypothetical protein